MDIVTQRDSLWSKSRLYQFSEHYKPFVLSVLKGEFWMNDRFKDLLEKKGYVLMARSNPTFDSLIKGFPVRSRCICPCGMAMLIRARLPTMSSWQNL